MLAGEDHAVSPTAEPAAPEDDGDECDEWDELEDPSGLPPMGSREEFTAIVDSIVADNAPQVFAIVHEYGDRVDSWIVGWGMALNDRAEVVDVDGGASMTLQSPHNALFYFGYDKHCTPRLVWVNPAAASPTEDNELT
jgi:hypothetical protein